MRQLIASVLLLAFGVLSTTGQVDDAVALPLQQAQRDLSSDGRAFLLEEAANASFFYWADSYDAMIFYRQVTPLTR